MEIETVHGLVVTTVCKTIGEFVARYRPRASGRTLFVPAIEARALGGECAFMIMLADGRVVLAGVCQVIDLYPTADNRYGRTGMRFAIRRMGQDSEVVWSKLVADPLDAIVDAAIDAATTGIDGANAGTISSNDLSAHAMEFEDQTTLPLVRAS